MLYRAREPSALRAGTQGFNQSTQPVTQTKRRIIFTNTVSKLEKKPFFVRMPSQEFKREVWLNLCFDLQSFMKLFQKCPEFQCFEGLTIGGNIKVRKIYLSKNSL